MSYPSYSRVFSFTRAGAFFRVFYWAYDFLIRFERGEGRVQYPLCFIFLTPSGASGKQMMAYASSRNQGKVLGGCYKWYGLP